MIDEERPTVAIFVAIEREHRAVDEFLNDSNDQYVSIGDKKLRVREGVLETPERRWNAVLRETGQGNENIARDYPAIVDKYELDVALLLGTAGGIKDVSVGDVVVAENVKGYEYGKEKEEFRSRANIGIADLELIEGSKAVRDMEWHDDCTSEDCDLTGDATIGDVASGSKVVDEPESATYQKLKRDQSGCIAVEMEGLGFYQASRVVKRFPSVAILGISDFVESNDQDESEDEEVRDASDDEREAKEDVEPRPVGEDERVDKDEAEHRNYMSVAAEHSFLFAQRLLDEVPKILNDENLEEWSRSGSDYNDRFLSGIGSSALPLPDPWFDRQLSIGHDPEEEVRIVDDFKEIIEDERRIILTATTGGGKSAFLRRFAEQQIREIHDKTVVVLDMKKVWDARDTEDLLEKDTNSERLKILLSRASVTDLGMDEFNNLVNTNDRLYLILDALNEVDDHDARDRILRTLNDYVSEHSQTGRMIVSTRSVSHYERSARWTEVQLHRIDEDEIREKLREHASNTRFDSLSTAERELLGIPFFLEKTIEQDTLRGGSKSAFIRNYFKQEVGIEDSESLAIIANAAFDMYCLPGGTSFPRDKFREKVDDELITILKRSGILHTNNEGSANFDHQLLHDYLAARHMADRPDTWNSDNFNDITIKASSTDVLTMVAEQIHSEEKGREFLNQVYDWNWPASIDCIRQTWAEDRPYPDEFANAILFLVAEKQFDPIQHTKQSVGKLKPPFNDLSDQIYEFDEMSELIKRAEEIDNDDEWFTEWQELFAKRPEDDVTEEDIAKITSDDAVVGWTVANMLKRTAIPEARQALLRFILRLRVFGREPTKGEDINRTVAWRTVHALGMYPADENVDQLVTALDKGYFWVRYGAVRSLIEMAARTDKEELRTKIFETIRGRIETMETAVKQEAAEALFFEEERPNDWREHGLRLLEKIEDHEEENERGWIQEKNNEFKDFV